MGKYKILESNARLNIHHFLVDTIENLKDLPKETGSTALIANTGDVYICNNALEWVDNDGVSNISKNSSVNVDGTLKVDTVQQNISVVKDNTEIIVGEYTESISSEELSQILQ